MKKPILLICVLAVLQTGMWVYGQGTIVFNNLGANDGLVVTYPDRWAQGPASLLNQDLNFALRVMTPADPLRYHPLHTWRLSDGSATGINVAPGRFADPSGTVFVIPDVPPGHWVGVEVWAWSGNYEDPFESSLSGGAWGFAYALVWAGTIADPPESLVRIDQLNVLNIPEPRGIVLALVGGAVLFLAKRLRGRAQG